MTMDSVNLKVWGDPKTAQGYAQVDGFSDEGERAVYFRVADQVRGRPILDLGVGGGRSVMLFRALSQDYVGLDYSSEMVECTRARYPFVDVRRGDARDLSNLPASRFALVAFSFNGLDCLAHDDRPKVLREVQRVLEPGGVFWFSTLNKDGPGRRFKPWHLQVPTGGLWSWVEAGLSLRRIPRTTLNYLSNRSAWHDEDGWCLAPLSAHDYRLVVHYTTLSAALREIEEAGFQGPVEVFDSSFGRPVREGDDLSGIFWFHILARR